MWNRFSYQTALFQLLLGVFLATVLLQTATADTSSLLFDAGVCYSKADDTILPVNGSCTTYIFCLNEQAFILPCPSGEGFSKAARGCVTLNRSDCHKTKPVTQISKSTRSCLDNEQRAANQAACVGKPFGQLVAYPGNCSLYLVCDCEYPTVMNCAPGTWFNPMSGNCDWPQNVSSCNADGTNNGATTTPTTSPITIPTTSPTTTASETDACSAPPGISANLCTNYPDGALLRYPYDCNAYVNCTLGCPLLNYCIPGKVFNAILLICDTPDTAHCTELELPTTTSTTEITTEEITTSIDDSTTSAAPCEALPGISKNICADLETGDLERYPYNCSAYIYCENGCSKLEYCANGTVYNEYLMICDTPDDEYCHEEEMPTTTTPSSTELTTTEVATTAPPPELEQGMCVGLSNGALLPYEPDCAAYVECLNEQPVLQDCPEGWLFNPELLLCDEPNAVVCYKGTTTANTTPTTTPTTIPTTIESTTTTSTTVITTPTTTTSTTPAYEMCKGAAYGDSFPDVNNCQQYYFCWGDNRSSLLPCPYNNWYNPQTGNCGPEVSPTACQIPMTTTTQLPVNVCEGQDFGTSFPIASNCQTYLMCTFDGNSMTLSCPTDNYFNPQTGNCGPGVSPTACQQQATTPTTTTTTEIPTTSTTTVKPTTMSTTTSPVTETTTTLKPAGGLCANSTNGTLIPYPNSCNKYVACEYPAPIAFSCPNGWYFNAELQICDLPENVDCTEQPEGGNTTTQIPGTATTSAPINNVCTGAALGETWAYEQSCSIYIECLGDDMWMYRSCAWNEYYDPAMRNCSADVTATACLADFTTTVTTPTTTTTVATPKPVGPCFGKPVGEIIAYPNNCSKYIVCEAPIPVGHACVDGLEFNAQQQQCVLPELADCSIKTTTTAPTTVSTTTTQSGGFPDCATAVPGETFIYPYDCSKYLICVEGKPRIMPCMPGTYYNPSLKWCDANTSPLACYGEANNTTTTVSSSETTGNTDTTASTESTEKTTTTEPITPDYPVGPCYGQPEGMLVPYPSNCSKYIICVTPIPIGYDCLTGLEFNALERRCMEPENAKCSWSTIQTTTTLLSTTTESTTPMTTTPKSTTIATIAPPLCNDDNNYATYPFPDDCSKYILCINGDPLYVPCMPGTYYNPESKVCSSETSSTACNETGTTTTESTTTEPTTPELTTMEPTTDSPTTESTTTESTTTVSTTTESTTTESTTTTTTAAPVCANEPDGQTYPFPQDCSKYIVCLNGLPIYVPCMPGTYYNPESKVCNSETTATACNETSTTTTTSTTLEPTTPELTTPESTTPESTTTTTTAAPICANDPDGQTYTYPQDCSKYIVCMNGAPLFVPCMPGTYFNPESKVCTSQTSATACNETGTTITTITPTTPTTITSTTPTTTTTTLAPTTIDPQTPNVCCGLALGTIIPYPGACDRYIECEYPVPIVNLCGNNQYFDATLLQCVAITDVATCHPASTVLERPSKVLVPNCSTVSPGSTLPFAGNCNKYYMCFGNQNIVMSCIEKWHYAPERKQCVPLNEYDCPWI